MTKEKGCGCECDVNNGFKSEPKNIIENKINKMIEMINAEFENKLKSILILYKEKNEILIKEITQLKKEILEEKYKLTFMPKISDKSLALVNKRKKKMKNKKRNIYININDIKINNKKKMNTDRDTKTNNNKDNKKKLYCENSKDKENKKMKKSNSEQKLYEKNCNIKHHQHKEKFINHFLTPVNSFINKEFSLFSEEYDNINNEISRKIQLNRKIKRKFFPPKIPTLYSNYKYDFNGYKFKI